MSQNPESSPEQAANIFVSYRHEDSGGYAGRLFERLSELFPGRVFMDIHMIKPGADFVDSIERAVASCRVLIVLIGRNWLSVTDAAGHRRLDDPEDFVRLEVATALTRKVRVIPALVQAAMMPRVDELPSDLAKLARHQSIELSDTRWAFDVGRLVDTLNVVLGERSASLPASAVIKKGQLDGLQIDRSAATAPAGRLVSSRVWIGVLVAVALALSGWMGWKVFDAARTKKTAEHARIEKLDKEMEKNRETSARLAAEIQELRLNPTEQTRLEQIRNKDPEKFREGSKSSKLWPPGTTLRVRFLDGNADKKEKFQNALATWLRYANLRATYGDTLEAEVRVSFSQPGDWELRGTDGLVVGHFPGMPSVNLGSKMPNYLHAIGQVLGLVYEIKNPQAKLNWNRAAMYRMLSDAPTFWTKQQVDARFFAPEFYPGSRPFDPQSIMMDSLPPAYFTDGVGFTSGTTLSESDKQYIAALYP
jgi:hypothetical protein